MEYIRLALYEIYQNKARTFLTLVGIIIGIAAVIIIIFIVQGADSFLMNELESIAPLDVMYVFGKWNGGQRPAGELTVADVEIIRNKEDDYIRAIAPRYMMNNSIQYADKENDCVIVGSTPSIYDVYGLKLGRGRFLTRIDEEENNKVIVLNYETSRKLFGNMDPIGKKVKLYGNSFTVVGVLAEKEETLLPVSVNENNVYVPFKTLERITNARYFTLFIRLKGREFIPMEIKRIQGILDSRHGLLENGQSRFYVRDWVSGLEQIKIVKTVLLILLSGVASITLLVAGIGLMNIMLVIITERTREVGLRKAIGATKRDILIQFIIESIIMCCTGGLLGVAAGYIGSEIALNIANNFIEFNFSVPGWAVIVSFVFTTLVGIFFGIYPAYKAAKLDPIEALRYE